MLLQRERRAMLPVDVVLMMMMMNGVFTKPAAHGPCIDCLTDPNHPHADGASVSNGVPGDAASVQEGVANTVDVEEIMHGDAHAHNASPPPSNPADETQVEGETVHVSGIVVSEESQQNYDPQTVDSENVGAGQAEAVQDLNSANSQDAGGVVGEMNSQILDNAVVEMQMAQDNPSYDAQAVDAAAEANLGQPADEREVGEGGETGQFHAGDVEEMVHGQQGVHASSLQQHASPQGENNQQLQAGNLEELMHGDAGVHDDPHPSPPEVKVEGEFKSGDVEEMVHGERHVHDRQSGEQQQQQSGPFKAGDVEEIVHGTNSHNVHDPTSRRNVVKEIATAGDVDKLMKGDNADTDDEHKGKVPTVLDGEHLMHGAGGHDHDVKTLKFFKGKTEKKESGKDPFSDIHSILMHGVGDSDADGHPDDKIRRGKKITYKDIMDLGLDEEMLKGIDLTQLLLQDAAEYDDWQREKLTIKGESPEASFWEQIGELRRRYLSFGRNDGKARDLVGATLDPEQKKWVTGPAAREGAEVEDASEDDVLHELELLGNTAPVGDRHKHGKERQHSAENGRDVTDL